MNVAKSLWASVQDDPVFMRRVNGVEVKQDEAAEGT